MMSFHISAAECVDSGTRNIGWLEEITVVDISVQIWEAAIFLLRSPVSSKLKVSILAAFKNEAVKLFVVSCVV
jgi:hypothetical protein